MTQIHEHDADLEIAEGSESSQDQETRWPAWLNAARILLLFVVFGVVVWVLTGLYKVNAAEVVVVERMGRFEATETEGGLHMGWPWPIDIIHRIPIGQTRRLEVNDFFQSPAAYEALKREMMAQGVRRDVLDAIFDPYLITGDKNVLNMKIAVQYRIKDPTAYLMSIAHGAAHNDPQVMIERENIIHQTSMHVLIRETAKVTIDQAFNDRVAFAERLLVAARAEAERLKLGVDIEKVDLLDVRWPAGVGDAFTEESRARQQKESAREAAKAYYESVKTAAKEGHYNRIVGEAQAYKKKVIDDARGETVRFRHVYEQYKKEPELTRINLYADAMTTVMKNVSRVILVQPGQKANLVIDPVEEKIPQSDPNAIGVNSGQQGPQR